MSDDTSPDDTAHGSPLSLFHGSRTVMVDWRLADLNGVLPGGVSVRLERDRDGASIQIIVTARGGQCLVDTPYGGVLYHKHSGLTEREAGEVTRAFADRLSHGDISLSTHFPHLTLGPSPDAAARRRYLQLQQTASRTLTSSTPTASTDLVPRALSSLYFDPPGLAEFLSPELTIDGSLIAGYSLRSIYLPAVGKRDSLDFNSYVLEFVDPDTADSPRLRLTVNGHDPGFGRAGALSLSVLGYTQALDGVPARLASLCSNVLALLLLKSTDDLSITVPSSATELRATAFPTDRGHGASTPSPELASVTSQPSVLNLALDADCGQRCTFCSVKAYVRPSDEGLAQLDRVRIQLRMARAQGMHELRLNGIDPLAFSHVTEVVREAATLGFTRLWVYSPCRRLADADFRRDFLSAASPMHFTISVPVYGVTAAVHDAVTNTPGSFEDVMTALGALCIEAPPQSVIVSTVIVKENLEQFTDIVTLALNRGLDLHPHLPYPMRQTTRDPYSASALRETDLVTHFVSRLVAFPPEEQQRYLSALGAIVPHPCILWRCEQRTRLPVFGARHVDNRQLLAGTEYRRSDIVHDTQGPDAQADAFAVATVQCPHAHRCALATVCPAEHYAVYQSHYGLGEFAAVTVAELYSTVPAHSNPSPQRSPR